MPEAFSFLRAKMSELIWSDEKVRGGNRGVFNINKKVLDHGRGLRGRGLIWGEL